MNNNQMLGCLQCGHEHEVNKELIKSKDTKHLLADYAHNAWAGWMKYLFEKSQHNDDGTVTIPSWAVKRWEMQMNTPYHNLSDEMKESDLEEAEKILRIIDRYKYPDAFTNK